MDYGEEKILVILWYQVTYKRTLLGNFTLKPGFAYKVTLKSRFLKKGLLEFFYFFYLKYTNMINRGSEKLLSCNFFVSVLCFLKGGAVQLTLVILNLFIRVKISILTSNSINTLEMYFKIGNQYLITRESTIMRFHYI